MLFIFLGKDSGNALYYQRIKQSGQVDVILCLHHIINYILLITRCGFAVPCHSIMTVKTVIAG